MSYQIIRALRSCTTHRIHNINKDSVNAIEGETVGRKQAVSVLYKERLKYVNTIAPLFYDKASFVALIIHGINIQHNVTEYLNPG